MPHACDDTGSIFSTTSDAKQSVLGVTRFNRFISWIYFNDPKVGAKSLSSSFQSTKHGWHHVCMTYDSKNLRLFIDTLLIDNQIVGSTIGLFHETFFAYRFGFDNELGKFQGHIDDILITPFDMSLDEIKAHYKGDRPHLVAKGFFLA